MILIVKTEFGEEIFTRVDRVSYKKPYNYSFFDGNPAKSKPAMPELSIYYGGGEKATLVFSNVISYLEAYRHIKKGIKNGEEITVYIPKIL